jgi:DNA-binding transcriptional LysR family regulator
LTGSCGTWGTPWPSTAERPKAGILTVVAIPSLANSLPPLAIQHFRTIRPHSSVVVQTARAPEVTQMVGSQAADLGAVVGPVGEADVHVSELGASSLACLLPRGTGWKCGRHYPPPTWTACLSSALSGAG